MAEQDYHQRLKSGRNDECLCGSKKKYKKCHLAADEKAQAEEFAKAQAAAAASMKADDKADGHEHHGHPQDRAHRHEAGGAPKAHTSMIPNRQVSAPRKTGGG